jgi:hypothetical protein
MSVRDAFDHMLFGVSGLDHNIDCFDWRAVSNARQVAARPVSLEYGERVGQDRDLKRTQAGGEGGRRVLFPIRVCSLDTLRGWEML